MSPASLLKSSDKAKRYEPNIIPSQPLNFTVWIPIKLWTQGSTACRCYFQLRAIGQLAAARARLDKAQQSLQRSHGPSGARMRRLHGNFCPELSMYVHVSCCPCHSYSHSLGHSHSYGCSYTHSHTQSHSRSHSRSRSLSCSHAYPHPHSHSHAHHTHTHDSAHTRSCTHAHASIQDSRSNTPSTKTHTQTHLTLRLTLKTLSQPRPWSDPACCCVSGTT